MYLFWFFPASNKCSFPILPLPCKILFELTSIILFEILMDVYASLFVFIRLWISRNLTHLAKDCPICVVTKLCLSWTKVKSRSQYTCYAIESSSYSTWLLARELWWFRMLTFSSWSFDQFFLYHQICVRNWTIYVIKAMNSEEFDRFSWRFLFFAATKLCFTKTMLKTRS